MIEINQALDRLMRMNQQFASGAERTAILNEIGEKLKELPLSHFFTDDLIHFRENLRVNLLDSAQLPLVIKICSLFEEAHQLSRSVQFSEDFWKFYTQLLPLIPPGEWTFTTLNSLRSRALQIYKGSSEEIRKDILDQAQLDPLQVRQILMTD